MSTNATDSNDPTADFIAAAVWHGPLDQAAAILGDHPEIASADIHTAAILGDDAGVRRFLELDPGNATAKGGPRGWDALTHLSFSKYLRLDATRSDAFLRAARDLLDHGASANTGFWEMDHQPDPEWESALYGAAGVAHHAELTRLLLDHGADPNDGETPYHAPETYDNAAVKVLVESGRLNAQSFATMLIRKADWHDYDGIKWLLEHGADVNAPALWGKTVFHHGVLRDNSLEIFELLLDHGANPSLVAERTDVWDQTGLRRSGVAMAARRGRGDVLDLLARRRIPIELTGVERLLAACATNDAETVRAIASAEPGVVRELVVQEAKILAEFAGNGNTAGVGLLLDLGVDVGALFMDGDLYWDIAKDSTGLHVAAWRARHDTVRFLIQRGAPVDAKDAKGRTPLMLAVRAAVDSYWTRLRSPDSVKALLDAGASTRDVVFPSGYAEVDNLLTR